MEIDSPIGVWPITPSVVIGVVVVAALYGWGVLYERRTGLGRAPRWWRVVAFYAGLLALLLALDSPLDDLADTYLWAHMVEHEVLILLVAPLLLVGEPLWPIWRAFPRAFRRTTLGWAIRQRWPRRVADQIGHVFFSPAVAVVLFIIGFSIWHVPSLYDLAETNESIHALQHLTFLAVSLLLWAQVIPSRPLKPRLSYVGQTLYVVIVGMYSNVMGCLFIFSTAAFYPYYADLPRTSGQMDALVDQHLAGAAMDVPGTIVLFLAISVLIWLWLRQDEAEGRAEAGPVVRLSH